AARAGADRRRSRAAARRAAGHRVRDRRRRDLRSAGEAGDGSVSELLEQCCAWMDEVHPHARHLERTLHGLLELDPHASEPARIAAATHDIERAYPDPSAGWDSAVSWDSPEYNQWHQDRCAEMVAAGLRERGASEDLVRITAGLVHVHEVGGWPEADL